MRICPAVPSSCPKHSPSPLSEEAILLLYSTLLTWPASDGGTEVPENKVSILDRIHRLHVVGAWDDRHLEARDDIQQPLQVFSLRIKLPHQTAERHLQSSQFPLADALHVLKRVLLKKYGTRSQVPGNAILAHDICDEPTHTAWIPTQPRNPNWIRNL